MPQQDPAPRFLNLLQIRMPAGAVASIAHRISGILIFLSLPVVIYLLDLSLKDPAGFALAGKWLDSVWARTVSVLLVWSLAHHILAGLRFLLIDLDIGVDRDTARRSAWITSILALLITLGWVGWIL